MTRGPGQSDRRLPEAAAIIGVDCATVAMKVGLARAKLVGRRWRLTDLLTCSSRRRPLDVVTAWLAEEPRSLLALDAPLGWPMDLGSSLAAHRAGEPIATPATKMFTRETDHAIHARFGKRPLDVGADRIARTAWAALEMMGAIRRTTGHALPMAWDPLDATPAAIEVYPAATLIAHGVPKGYKIFGGESRAAACRVVIDRFDIPEAIQLTASTEHAFDAVLCVLAGSDFLAGDAAAPENARGARREGWIWVKA